MKRYLPFILVILCLYFHANKLVWAQTEEEKEQPLQEVFQTELVYPQEKNEVQLTLSPQYNNGKEENLFTLPFTVEYGITDRWQVELQWNTFVHRDPGIGIKTSGIGDLEIGTKYSFMNIADSDFHAAVGFSLNLPVASINKQLSEGKIEYEPFIIVARDLPAFGSIQLFTQLGATFNQQVKSPSTTSPDLRISQLPPNVIFQRLQKYRLIPSYTRQLRARRLLNNSSTLEDGEQPDGDIAEEDNNSEFNWHSGFFIPIKRWRITSEFNWSRGDEDQMYLTPGLVYSAGSWEFGLGVPIGLNRHSDDARVIFNLIYEFNLSDK